MLNILRKRVLFSIFPLPCSHTPDPPHSFHLLRCLPCSHKPDPPHSSHKLRTLPCSVLNILFSSTSAGANRSYYGSSYTSITLFRVHTNLIHHTPCICCAVFRVHTHQTHHTPCVCCALFRVPKASLLVKDRNFVTNLGNLAQLYQLSTRCELQGEEARERGPVACTVTELLSCMLRFVA